MEPDPQHWYSTNLVGVPAGLVSSLAFNEHPQTLNIAGVREIYKGLFNLLEEAVDLTAAASIFRHYMEIVFGLHSQGSAPAKGRPRRFHSSYLKLLEGWGFDANSPQGAVLKGWVESRFGLIPTYHKAPLTRFPSPAWVGYLEAKFSSRYHNNSIHAQLDLLYEFCQWAIRRFNYAAGEEALPEKAALEKTTQEKITLWRGINCADEHVLVSGSLRSGDCVVRLNNLVSFTTSRARAEEFGDWILETQVPIVKFLFFPGLLSGAT
ncbi:MAG: NAD(+)--dinitrogen-reductase ADP-D-ribosyltransferase, partial [Methylophilaceae bacterium]|nr:NAD(+)--dinitrogen-reductase ADP-D-ribosyltransferase [Methylophilaceae bacterium]